MARVPPPPAAAAANRTTGPLVLDLRFDRHDSKEKPHRIFVTPSNRFRNKSSTANVFFQTTASAVFPSLVSLETPGHARPPRFAGRQIDRHHRPPLRENGGKRGPHAPTPRAGKDFIHHPPGQPGPRPARRKKPSRHFISSCLLRSTNGPGKVHRLFRSASASTFCDIFPSSTFDEYPPT